MTVPWVDAGMVAMIEPLVDALARNRRLLVVRTRLPSWIPAGGAVTARYAPATHPVPKDVWMRNQVYPLPLVGPLSTVPVVFSGSTASTEPEVDAADRILTTAVARTVLPMGMPLVGVWVGFGCVVGCGVVVGVVVDRTSSSPAAHPEPYLV